MTKTSLRIVYASATRTLYVTADGDVRSGTHDGGSGNLSRHCIDGGELMGLKTADFDVSWGDRFDALPSEGVSRARRSRSAAAR